MKKKIVNGFTLLFSILLLVPLNAKAIMTSLDITGDKQLYINQSVNLKASFNMSNDLNSNNQNDNKDINNNVEDVTSKSIWTSSDESIAIVNGQGVVTGLKSGKATISANYNDVISSYDIVVVDNYNSSSSTDNNYDILTILTAVICPSIAIAASIAIIIVERKNIKANKN